MNSYIASAAAESDGGYKRPDGLAAQPAAVYIYICAQQERAGSFSAASREARIFNTFNTRVGVASALLWSRMNAAHAHLRHAAARRRAMPP